MPQSLHRYQHWLRLAHPAHACTHAKHFECQKTSGWTIIGRGRDELVATLPMRTIKTFAHFCDIWRTLAQISGLYTSVNLNSLCGWGQTQCGDHSGDTHVDVFCKPRAVKSQAVYTSALFVKPLLRSNPRWLTSCSKLFIQGHRIHVINDACKRDLVEIKVFSAKWSTLGSCTNAQS